MIYKKQRMLLTNRLKNIAKNLYRGRDSSHGIIHVYKVRDNAMEICNKLNIKDPNVLIKIEAAALFHDLWDHKYIHSSSNKYMDIKNNFRDRLKEENFSEHDIKDIEIIIDNVSLSREIEYRKNDKVLNLKHLQLMRDIVSDADKLEMLGNNGISRIIKFQEYKRPDTKPEELNFIIKKVYVEKISKLLKENYIKTKPAKDMAEPLMLEMNEYIKNIKD